MLRITARASSGVRQPCSPLLGLRTRSCECWPPRQWIVKITSRALRQVEACQARLEPAAHDMMQSAGAADFLRLAKDLETAWTSPNVSMRSRQQLLRALVVDIIADVDEAVPARTSL